MSSSFSVVKPSYLENTSNIVVNGNLTVNGTVSNYVDTSLNSLWENVFSTFGSLTDTNRYQGGVLAPNGKIYCLPALSSNVLIIDPINNTLDTTTIRGLDGTSFKCYGGVLAPNGKIYGIPTSVSYVTIIDPVTNTVDTTTIKGLPVGNVKWGSGVLAPNGKR